MVDALHNRILVLTYSNVTELEIYVEAAGDSPGTVWDQMNRFCFATPQK